MDPACGKVGCVVDGDMHRGAAIAGRSPAEDEFCRCDVDGLVRRMDCHGAVEWVGQYHRGHPCGNAWKLLPDGAMIKGKNFD